MPAALIVQLIIQVGLPLTQELIAIWEKGGTVSSADFSALIAKTGTTARQVMLNQLKAANVDPASPQALALLAQVPA